MLKSHELTERLDNHDDVNLDTMYKGDRKSTNSK